MSMSSSPPPAPPYADGDPRELLTPPVAARVATAPISWGVCEVPGWGHQLPVDRVLGEMAALGFTHTELGSAGWLPEQAGPLRAALDAHGLELLASFVPLVLHRPDEAAEARSRAEDMARLLAEVGGRYFNSAPVTTYDWAPRQELTEDEWHHLYAMLGELDELCAAHGLRHVVHEHEGCVVETADEVRRVLDHTDSALVLDTGHLALGGADPVALARDHADRFGLVHLKDLDLEVGRRFRTESLSLMEAVQAGLFPALGRGHLAIAEVVEALEAQGYGEWYVVEQDCAITGDMPGPDEGPALDVAASIRYIATNIDAFGERQA